jgi:hypothetical protein
MSKRVSIRRRQNEGGGGRFFLDEKFLKKGFEEKFIWESDP